MEGPTLVPSGVKQAGGHPIAPTRTGLTGKPASKSPPRHLGLIFKMTCLRPAGNPMVKTIVHKVKFKAAPAKLYDIYMDSKRHSAATGSPAKISKGPGSAMSAWDGFIAGRVLATVPKTFIAQTWRGSDWKASDPDSFLILHFEKTKGGSLVTMVHAGVPDDQEEALGEGWHENYWAPWRTYLGER